MPPARRRGRAGNRHRRRAARGRDTKAGSPEPWRGGAQRAPADHRAGDEPMWQRAASAAISSPRWSGGATEGTPRVLVTMTNDNIPALYFYQRRGYRLAAVSAARSRRSRRTGTWRALPGFRSKTSCSCRKLSDTANWATCSTNRGDAGTRSHRISMDLRASATPRCVLVLQLLQLFLHFSIRLQLVLHLEGVERRGDRARQHPFDIAVDDARSVTRRGRR